MIAPVDRLVTVVPRGSVQARTLCPASSTFWSLADRDCRFTSDALDISN